MIRTLHVVALKVDDRSRDLGRMRGGHSLQRQPDQPARPCLRGLLGRGRNLPHALIANLAYLALHRGQQLRLGLVAGQRGDGFQRRDLLLPQVLQLRLAFIQPAFAVIERVVALQELTFQVV